MEPIDSCVQLVLRPAANALALRPAGAEDLAAESAAWRELSETLIHAPSLVRQRSVELALPLCRADVAGLCLLNRNALGKRVLQWAALSGDWSTTTPEEDSRRLACCTGCLQGDIPLLGVRRGLHNDACARSVRVDEALLIPLFENRATPQGALFIGRLTPGAGFCRSDLRIAEWLAAQVRIALKLSCSDSAPLQQRAVADDLEEERSRRRRAEASNRSLQLALASKNAEIQEAHHRVKNTLQIAASLLSLRKEFNEASVTEALRRARDQLYVLANIHDVLARCGDGRQELPVPRLLELVCNALRQSFPEAGGRVLLRSSADDIELPAGQSIVLALAANELITNAYKHAFPPPMRGEISVAFESNRSSEVLLRVTDTGVGMKTHGRPDGLGLSLVRALAGQLSGVLSFANEDGEPGARIELRFPRRPRIASVASA